MHNFRIFNAGDAEVELKIHLTYTITISMPERKGIAIGAVTVALGIATGLGSGPLIELLTGRLQTLDREPHTLIYSAENLRLHIGDEASRRFMTGESLIDDAINRTLIEQARYQASLNNQR